MNRKDFLRQGCLMCMGIIAGAALLESCAPVHYTAGMLGGNGITVGRSEFEDSKGKRPYIIVRHDDLQFPICVYHLGNDQYSAVWMSCSHQGAELQVAGDQLTCPAHGSEFDKHGLATQGPATAPLRTFPVTVTGNELFIDLRKTT
jgi:Rieske Fe-S protein